MSRTSALVNPPIFRGFWEGFRRFSSVSGSYLAECLEWALGTGTEG